MAVGGHQCRQNYAHKIKDFEFTEGVFQLCSEAVNNKILLFVVENQAGIGRGLFPKFIAQAGSEQFCFLPNRLSRQGGRIDEGEVLIAGLSNQIHRDALVKAHQAAALGYG